MNEKFIIHIDGLNFNRVVQLRWRPIDSITLYSPTVYNSTV